MKNYLLLSLSLIFALQASTQVIYISSLNNDLYRLNISDCSYEFVVNVQSEVFDISFHPNGNFYGISGNGNFFEIDTLNGFTSFIHDFTSNWQTFNSLTIGGNGIIYTIGDEGELWSYEIATGIEIDYGDIGFSATGDLTFFEGNLYAAVTGDRIVLIDINNPPNSTVIIDDNISGDIFGIVSFAEDCNNINSYAITDGNSDVYQIDFATNSLQFICDLDIEIGGGASTFEFFASSPIGVQNISVTNPECGLNNGSVTVEAIGGIGQLNYSIDNLSFQSNGTFNNLSVGSYTIVINDDNDCTISQSIELMEDDGPQIENIISSDATCGDNNGSLIITVNGGTGQLAFSIDGISFQASNNFNNLTPGNYLITVQDQNNCTDIQSTEVQQLDAPQIEDIISSDATCGDNNGSLIITVNGGTGSLAFSIDGISFQASNIFNNLVPDNYSITVQDQNNCTDIQNAEVQGNDSPNLFVVLTNPILCDENNGVIVVEGDNGSPPFEYSIDGVNFQQSGSFEELIDGTYIIFIQDALGCLDSIEIQITQEESAIISSIEINSTTCGEDNGTLQIIVEGGFSVQYSINGIDYQNSDNFGNLAAGNYTVTIQDSNNCTDTQSVLIEQSQPPLIQTIEITSASCGEANGSLIIIGSGGAGNLEYSINGSDFQEAQEFIDLEAGIYTLFTRNEHNCIAISEIELFGSPPLFIKSIQSTPSGCGEANGNLSFETEGGTGQKEYSLNNNAFQPSLTFNNLESGIYDLIVLDEVGCEADTSITVNQESCPIYIPNVFSPNYDGINDFFKVYPHPNFKGKINSFNIFNRWGALIYEAQNLAPIDIGWDGTFKGKKLESGVYVFFINVQFENGKQEIIEGEIILIK